MSVVVGGGGGGGVGGGEGAKPGKRGKEEEEEDGSHDDNNDEPAEATELNRSRGGSEQKCEKLRCCLRLLSPFSPLPIRSFNDWLSSWSAPAFIYSSTLKLIKLFVTLSLSLSLPLFGSIIVSQCAHGHFCSCGSPD